MKYRWISPQMQRRVQDYVHQGQILFLGGAEIFSLGAEFFMNRERLVLASAPYAPHVSFFIWGRNLLDLLDSWSLRGGFYLYHIHQGNKSDKL